MKKIGEVNYKSFKTYFSMTEKVENFLKKEKISEAYLLPEGGLWYEVMLFDAIDENEDGLPDKKFGKEFSTIYYGFLDSRDYKNGILTENDNVDNIKEIKKAIIDSAMELNGKQIKFITIIK
ncbi:MAG: hypothetical protein AABW82_03075 [Nanoarchaeota archaeon]